MCCVYTQNEVNVDLEISLYNDVKVQKSHLLYVTLQVEKERKKEKDGGREKENERKTKESKRQCEAEKGISHKFDPWPNSLELRDN